MISKKTIFELAVTLGGIPVLGVLPGSPAAQSGIRYGDVVLVVNGVRTQTLPDYIEAKGLRSDGMTVTLFRDGTELSLELTYRKRTTPVDTAQVLADVIGMRVFAGEETTTERPREPD